MSVNQFSCNGSPHRNYINNKSIFESNPRNRYEIQIFTNKISTNNTHPQHIWGLPQNDKSQTPKHRQDPQPSADSHRATPAEKQPLERSLGSFERVSASRTRYWISVVRRRPRRHDALQKLSGTFRFFTDLCDGFSFLLNVDVELMVVVDDGRLSFFDGRSHEGVNGVAFRELSPDLLVVLKFWKLWKGLSVGFLCFSICCSGYVCLVSWTVMAFYWRCMLLFSNVSMILLIIISFNDLTNI